MMRFEWNTAALLVAAFIGCSSGDDAIESPDPSDTADEREPTTGPGTEPGDAPFRELFDQGIGRYLGLYTPSDIAVRPGGVTNYVFDGSDGGPECYTGNTFQMSTRDGTRDELMIFLQGGGFCAPGGCEALEVPIPFLSLGILDPNDPSNPAANYDVGYVSYCDGTLFSGDRDVDGRSFRGLKNLSASLDVIASAYPDPSRILLIGNSAGGAGTHYALPLVRSLYPEVDIDLVNDSGPGVYSPGGLEATIEYWNSGAFFPESCESCTSGDNLADYQAYLLTEDPDARMAFIGSKQDEVIVAGLPFDGDTYEEALLTGIEELDQVHPARFRSLIADGEEHTFVLSAFDYAIAGTTVRQWITDMLDDSDEWVSLRD